MEASSCYADSTVSWHLTILIWHSVLLVTHINLVGNAHCIQQNTCSLQCCWQAFDNLDGARTSCNSRYFFKSWVSGRKMLGREEGDAKGECGEWSMQKMGMTKCDLWPVSLPVWLWIYDTNIISTTRKPHFPTSIILVDLFCIILILAKLFLYGGNQKCLVTRAHHFNDW